MLLFFLLLFFFSFATTFNCLLLVSFCFLFGSEKGTNAILLCVRVLFSDDSTAKDTIVARRCLEGYWSYVDTLHRRLWGRFVEF